MKKSILFVTVVLLLFASVSCRNDKNEWEKYYGYTSNALGGTYFYSNASNAFENLTEGDYCHLCSDADITITPTNENTLRFDMVSDSNNYHKIYMGKAPLNSNDFMIDIKGNTQVLSKTSFIVYNLNSRVYKNGQGKIRLMGNSSHNRYGITFHIVYDVNHIPVDTIPDTTLSSSTRYYFDVINN